MKHLDVNSSSSIFERRGNPWLSPKEQREFGHGPKIKADSKTLAALPVDRRAFAVETLKKGARIKEQEEREKFLYTQPKDARIKAKPKPYLKDGSSSRNASDIKRTAAMLRVSQAIGRSK